MVFHEAPAAEQGRLQRRARDVTDGDLSGDRGPPGRAQHRGPQHLVQVRRDDPSLRRALRPLKARRNHDRRDHTLSTPEAPYLESVGIAGVLHAALVRSPHAHARIERVDGAAALALPGVVAVLSLAELPECAGGVPPLVPSPRLRPYLQPVIAGPDARCVGEAVAVV